MKIVGLREYFISNGYGCHISDLEIHYKTCKPQKVEKRMINISDKEFRQLASFIKEHSGINLKPEKQA